MAPFGGLSCPLGSEGIKIEQLLKKTSNGQRAVWQTSVGRTPVVRTLIIRTHRHPIEKMVYYYFYLCSKLPPWQEDSKYELISQISPQKGDQICGHTDRQMELSYCNIDINRMYIVTPLPTRWQT